jgi:hypothetical protein
MSQAPEIGEFHSFVRQLFQIFISDCTYVSLVFEHNDQDAIEMFVCN